MKLQKTKVSVMIFLFLIAAFMPLTGSLAGIDDVNRTLNTAAVQENGQGSAGAAQTEAKTDDSGVVMCDQLNVRSSPWGEIIGKLDKGKKIDILAREGEWLKIKYNGRDAYIHSGYVSTATKPSSAFMGYIDAGKLNVRTGPWAAIIGTLSRGTKVEILGKTGDWYKIRYNGKDAVIHSKYVSKNKVEAGADKPASSSNDKPSTSTPPAAGSGGLSHPLSGAMNIGSKYGMRMHPIQHVWKMHNGVDIGRPTGTPLAAMGNGKVIFSGWSGGAGFMIKIKYDNGYTSTYMHCLPSGAKPVGARVEKGQTVAKVNNTGGSTGPHLHLEIMNPSGARIDPAKVL